MPLALTSVLLATSAEFPRRAVLSTSVSAIQMIKSPKIDSKPPVDLGVGSVTNFISYINVTTKLSLKRKKPWREHCKIS